MFIIKPTHHRVIAVRTPHTGISETLLLDSGFSSLASVSDSDRAFDSTVKHIHGGSHCDVITSARVGERVCVRER